MRELLRLGTRGSALAIAQTQWVVGAILAHFPQLEIHVETIVTSGDRFQGPIGPGNSTKGLFVKEIEEALLAERIDAAVHSLKDMPAVIHPELQIAATPKRADPRDALIGSRWEDLPIEAKVGTGSPRRRAQLLYRRPDLQIVEVRGNVDSRLRKQKERGLHALVLASAGLERLGREKEITQRLDPEVCLPSPGQGSLALQIRQGDSKAAEKVCVLHDSETFHAVSAERELLAFFQAGCNIPVGALGQVRGARLYLQGMVASLDGRRMIRDQEEGDLRDAGLGQRLGEKLFLLGAKELLRS